MYVTHRAMHASKKRRKTSVAHSIDGSMVPAAQLKRILNYLGEDLATKKALPDQLQLDIHTEYEHVLTQTVAPMADGTKYCYEHENPTALLQLLCSLSSTWFCKLLYELVLIYGTLHFLINTDGTVPGNQLYPDVPRSSEVVWWPLKEFPYI